MHDVRVREEGGDARLAQKHLHVPRVARALGEQALEGDDALEPHVAPLERHLDPTHPPLADDEERPIAVADRPERWLERCLRGCGGGRRYHRPQV